MLPSTVFLLATAAVTAAVPSQSRRFLPNGRIVGGSEARIEDNPWQISLESSGSHHCGGSIIAPDIILTAAHCIDRPISQLYVLSGSSDITSTGGGTPSLISKTVVNDNYDGYSNDVALIFLEEPLTFDETTQAIVLADEEPAAGENVRVTGWGVLSDSGIFASYILYGVEINIVDRQECANDYLHYEDAYVDETMLCAGVPEGGKDSCSGDSGGPLSHNATLVGIVSWGNGCGRVGYPGVYTSISALRTWIRDNSGI